MLILSLITLLILLLEISLIWAVAFLVVALPGMSIGWLIARFAPSIYLCIIVAEIFTLLPLGIALAVDYDFAKAGPLLAYTTTNYKLLLSHGLLFAPITLAIVLGYINTIKARMPEVT